MVADPLSPSGESPLPGGPEAAGASLDSGSGPSPDSGSNADAIFAEQSAAVIADAGAMPSDPGAAPAAGVTATQLAPGVLDIGLPNGMHYEIRQETIRQWIDVPFHAVAVQLRKPELELIDLDRELMTPAVTGCLNRYLPDLLKRTSSPELAALMIAFVVYGVRIGAGALIGKVVSLFSSEPDTSTAGSAESSGSSGSPASERPTSRRNLSGLAIPVPSASSSTTQ
jgi:hypothetical protein